jgi:fatty-acyl-CoA synthase
MESYARGPDSPLLSTTLGDLLAATAARVPGSLALVSRHQSERFTYRELLAEVDRTAGGLIDLGLVPGDRIGVWSSNCVEWVLLQLGAARAGVVLVNVNPAYRSHELGYVLRKSGMKALFLWPQDARADYRQILEEARPGNDAALRHAIFFDSEAWRRLRASTTVPAPSIDPHDVANIQYTSGTTGSPKGVLLTHHNLVNNGAFFAAGLRYTEADRVCVPVPLYHCFGCVIGVIACVTAGAAIILPAAGFDPRATLAAVADERATSIYGVPTMFIAELAHPDFATFDLTSLRTGVMAGAPCPIEIMKRVLTEMHCPEITIAYGQTETSPGLTLSDVADDVDRRVSTVGAAMANTELKIVDTETGRIVDRGAQGEICARGYMIMKGYDQEPEATARTIDADGWLHTGDLGVMRPDGYVRVTGRAKDLVIRGGENIYPREVEEFLYTHPGIAEAQVVGLPDERLGETLVAWVRLRQGHETDEEEIRTFCRGKIAHFKIPEFIRVVDAFPMTVTGKVQKFKIREIEIEERGRQRAAGIETA